MAHFKTSDHLQQLQQIWLQLNPKKNQYIQKQQFKQFVKTVFNNTKIGETVKDPIEDKIINVWLKQYLSEMHNLQEGSVKDVQFKYDQALGFLDWLVDISLQADQKQNQGLQQRQQHNQSNLFEKPNSKIRKQEQEELQNQINQYKNNKENLPNNQMQASIKKLQQKGSQNKNVQQSFGQNNNSSFVQAQSQSRSLSPKLQNKANSIQISKKSDNNHQIKNKQDFSLKDLQTKYKEHLQIVFQHYCKLTYATGNDPTFQQIQHKTTIMTINKFMIFAKEFQIAQILSKTSNTGSKKLNARTYLIQTFKKNAQCYKQMSFDQFCQTLWKIAEDSFSSLKILQDPNDIRQSEILSYQKIRMLQYMEISFFKQFKQKMKKLNINYVLKTNANNEPKQKKMPFNYKFKFQPANHPSHKNIDMIAQHIKSLQQQRRQLQSQRKETLQERKNKNSHDLNLNPGTNVQRNKVYSKLQNMQRSNSHKNYTNGSQNIHSQKRLGTKNQTQDMERQNKNHTNSNKDNIFVQKKLGPLLPPKQISRNTNSSVPNIPSGITGYAKIHKAKKGLKINQQESQTPNNGSRKTSKDERGYRLNSIVEEAKNLVNNQQQYRSNKVNTSSSKDGISSSHPISRQRYETDLQNGSNSRVQGYVKNSKISQQLSYLQKNISNVSEGNELKGLIDLNDSDEDQFLQQHLKKQKQKKNQIGRRIDKKISSLNIYN